jgi:hypothetical protein
MPSPTFQLAKSQISDIEALCDLGSAALQRIVEALSVDGPTIQPTIVKQRIATVVGPETAERISRVLLAARRTEAL